LTTQRQDLTRVLPGGFDIVFDGIGEDGYRPSVRALKRGGVLWAYGYSVGGRCRRSVAAHRGFETALRLIGNSRIWPSVAERISSRSSPSHTGVLKRVVSTAKLVLYPDLPWPLDRLPLNREPA
jgi:hypothetical protein